MAGALSCVSNGLGGEELNEFQEDLFAEFGAGAIAEKLPQLFHRDVGKQP